jgi:hypothetical protein
MVARSVGRALLAMSEATIINLSLGGWVARKRIVRSSCSFGCLFTGFRGFILQRFENES